MLSDVMIPEKAFTALRYIVAAVAMLATGLEKTIIRVALLFFSFQVI